MVVEEMNILTTVFLRYDNQKIIYPNAVLATKPISNYYRSPDMGDAIDFCIHISTPTEKIATMKQQITRYDAWKCFHLCLVLFSDSLFYILFMLISSRLAFKILWWQYSLTGHISMRGNTKYFVTVLVYRLVMTEYDEIFVSLWQILTWNMD